MPEFRTGTDDFKEFIDDNGYFVDKSLLIKNVIEGNKVSLLPRPRRFGKTLNMTMLRYFFEKTDEDNSYLFEGLKITQDADCMTHQGQYPVIYLSLKDVKGTCWDDAAEVLAEKVSHLYRHHENCTSALQPEEKSSFNQLCLMQASSAQLNTSLKNLITYLYTFHGKPAVVLIDEYDSPVIEARKNGYYEEMINFMRSWLGGGLKHENARALYRAVVTGILRIAKESVFSDLNNLKVASILQTSPFADKFGFTQSEMDKVLSDFGLDELSPAMRQWYDGYIFGGHTIYNPWSVINSIENHPDPFAPHWINTASNDLIHAELETGGLELKRDLEKLLAGEELRYPITESLTFSELDKSPDAIWSFLLFCGYLRASDPQQDPIDRTVTLWKLEIPNLEAYCTYKSFVKKIYLTGPGIRSFLDCFIKPEQLSQLQPVLQELVCNLVSYHDTAKYPEAVFHAFVLGLLANLRDIYEIRSNPETGYGRADIIMRPKTTAYPSAFVIEFKAIDKTGDMEKATQEALAQIEKKSYAAQLLEAGVDKKHMRRLAIVVAGKNVRVTPAP